MRKQTHVLLTDHELALIRRAATSSGLSVGAFLRTAGLSEALAVERRALTPTTPAKES